MTEYEKLNAQLDILNIVYHVNDELKTYESIARQINELFEQIDIIIPNGKSVVTNMPTIKSHPVNMTGHFIGLKVLSNKVTKKDQDAYDAKLKEYDKAVRQYESMGIGDPPPPPDDMDTQKEYKTAYINFEDMYILTWLADYDDEHECPIIVLEYTTKYTPTITNTINIQMHENEWIRLIQNLGGYAQ
jgi:hypothetical protein